MDVYRPATLRDALDAAHADPEATILAGGTDLMVEVTYAGRRPSAVITLRGVDELREWHDGFIGAGVTWSRLEHSRHTALAAAARTVGSPQIRNAGTIGGNLGTASPAGDALPFLAAADAAIVLESRHYGRRSLRWDEFLTGPKRNALRPGEIIVGVDIPRQIPGRQAFAKVGTRNAMVISIASACLTRDDDGTTRIALGSVGPTPMRARRAEAMISAEADPSPASVEEFGRLVAEEVAPITDHRSTAAYRRHAANVIAKRLLVRCLP